MESIARPTLDLLDVSNPLQQPFVWHFFPKRYYDTERVSPHISPWPINIFAYFLCKMCPKDS